MTFYKLYPDFVISCHPFRLQIKESSKDIGWKLLEVNATVFGTHKISRTEEKGSRNVSFYIKFSVLEVGHAISKKANWDMQQSKVFVDVSLSNYKKIWKTLVWHLCKKSNSFKFLKIKFLISRNSITCVSNSCRGYDLMLLFLHVSIFRNQKWIIGFVCLPKKW